MAATLKYPLWSSVIGDVPPALLTELFGSDSIVNTTLTTVGNGTLTATALVGGQISRTGPTGPFTDTTDTAANILTADGGDFVAGDTFLIRIKNLTAFPETITAGAGVTWSAVTVIPPFSVGNYFATLGGTQAAPTFAISHMGTSPAFLTGAAVAPVATPLTTVGAGVITAAGFAGGVTTRSGSTTAFSDTTDTADAIIAAGFSSASAIGSSFTYTYVNNTVAAATLGGGTGVTVSGITVVPAHSWAEYLVTYTAADTITMVGIEQGYFPKVGTLVASGATGTTVSDARVTAASQVVLTLATVGGTIAGAPFLSAITPGTSFVVKAGASDTSTYTYAILG